MKIIAFGDLHYFAGDIESAVFNRQTKLVQYAVPMLEALTEKNRREHKADLAVNLGDLIQDANDHDTDIEALGFMFDKLDRMGCPCYSILGNHDLKMMDSVREVEEIMGYKSSYSFDTDGYHLVFLTTEVRPELGISRGGCYKAHYLSEETLEWLREDLGANSLPTVVFTHYGLAENPEIDDECMFMKNRADLKKILREDGSILAVFSAHLHISDVIDEDGVRYYVIGSMIADPTASDNPSGDYVIIELEDGKISVTDHKIKKDELVINRNGEKI